MNKLGQETGAPAEDHMAEARRILVDLDLLGHVEEMDSRDREFVEKMAAQVEEGKWTISGRQLFWLRDLKDKYCV